MRVEFPETSPQLKDNLEEKKKIKADQNIIQRHINEISSSESSEIETLEMQNYLPLTHSISDKSLCQNTFSNSLNSQPLNEATSIPKSCENVVKFTEHNSDGTYKKFSKRDIESSVSNEP